MLIDCLTYDREAIQATKAKAEANGKPREAIVKEVESYTCEIIPSFNAYARFREEYWFT